MKKYINLFLRYFCYITTGSLIAVIFGFSISHSCPTLKTLWEILLCSLPATIATIITYNVKTDNFNLPIRMLIHYICLCLIMGTLGCLFGWISPNIMGMIFMCLCVAGVYAFTYLASYLSDRENAKNINKALEEKYKNPEG